MSDSSDDTYSGQMSFGEHLEELRSRLIRCLLAIGVAFIVCWIFRRPLMQNVVLRPHHLTMSDMKMPLEPVQISYQETFVNLMWVCLISAIFVASPVIFYQVWRFVRTGLYPKERRYVTLFAPFSALLFICGVLFGFFLMFPIGLRFLLSYSVGISRPMIRLDDYVRLFTLMTLVLGLLFELPLVVALLAKIGVAEPADLLAGRKYAILACFILAAFLTPPDPYTQVSLALPMILLYDIGLLIVDPGWASLKRLGKMALLLLCVVVAAGAYLGVFGGSVGKITSLTGSPEILSAGRKEWQPAASGRSLRGESSLRTGAGQRIIVATSSDGRITLNQHTRLQAVSKRVWRLYEGEVLVEARRGKEPFTLMAAYGRATAPEGALDLKLSSDTVIITAVKGQWSWRWGDAEIPVAEGSQLTLPAGGRKVNVEEVTGWTGEKRK